MTPRKDAERDDGNKAGRCCAAGRCDFGIPVLLCYAGSGAGGGLTLCAARNGAAMQGCVLCQTAGEDGCKGSDVW